MNILKIGCVALLGGALGSCGKQVDVASDVALRHQHDAAFQRQVELLQAEQVKVSATAAAPGGPARPVLTLEVVNPYGSPEPQPDTLKQRVHKLAHLLVADLVSPARYQAVNAQATFKKGVFSSDSQSSSQAFIYSVASLR
ncbi:MAG: hypothetical protein EOO36_20710 [Cytophagaceae bacterium]|nr:MAG: hypothetical protein EOO36_20710 [Cytophagaceae bacterium]